MTATQNQTAENGWETVAGLYETWAARENVSGWDTRVLADRMPETVEVNGFDTVAGLYEVWGESKYA